MNFSRLPEVNFDRLIWLAAVGVIAIVAVICYAIYFAVSHLRIV